MFFKEPAMGLDDFVNLVKEFRLKNPFLLAAPASQAAVSASAKASRVAVGSMLMGRHVPGESSA